LAEIKALFLAQEQANNTLKAKLDEIENLL
jgi:hypothetical protein